MKKLTQEEKELLRAKIENQQQYTRKKEQSLIRLKHHQHRTSIVLRNWLPSANLMSHQGYAKRLRASRRKEAFSHVFDREKPLRHIELTDTERKQLKERLDTHLER